MITLKEFRDRRTTGTMSQSLLELTFYQLFEQWYLNNQKFTVGEEAGYSKEARMYRDLIGIERACEIMDEISSKNKIEVA